MKTKVIFRLCLIATAAFVANQTGAQTIEVTSTGVGIGTTSPQAALDVIKPGNTNVYENGIRANRPDSQGQYAFMGYSGADAYFGSVYTGGGTVYGALHFRQYTQGMAYRDVLNIDYYGNVGVGTTTPGSRLEVSGDTDSYTSGIGFTGVGTGARSYRTFVSTSGSLVFNDATAGHLARFSINSSGNVGIGSTTPDARLTVAGGDNTAITVKRSGVASAYLGDPGSTDAGCLVLYDSGGNPTVYVDGSSGATAISTRPVILESGRAP